MLDSMTQKGWKKVFFPFWISQMFSILGSSLVMFTLVWWLTEETGSATVLATATMFGMIPEIIVQPFAGAIVDRLNRKQVIIFADAAIAIATLFLGILFYFEMAGVWAIYGIMLIRAIGGAFHYPAEQASVALMVPDEQLAKLAGLNQAARGVINIVAAPAGCAGTGVYGCGRGDADRCCHGSHRDCHCVIYPYPAPGKTPGKRE